MGPVLGERAGRARRWSRRLFGTASGTDASRCLPWLLDGASPERTVLVLARMPGQLVAAYRDQWRPANGRLDLWSTTSEATAS